MKNAFFGGEIRKGETRVGLDDADSGKVREVEALGDGLGADDDLVSAGFKVVVELVEGVLFSVVTVETDDFGSGEEFGEFGF